MRRELNWRIGMTRLTWVVSVWFTGKTLRETIPEWVYGLLSNAIHIPLCRHIAVPPHRNCSLQLQMLCFFFFLHFKALILHQNYIGLDWNQREFLFLFCLRMIQTCVFSVKCRADPNKQNRKTAKKRVTCLQHFIPPFANKSISNSTLHRKLLKYSPLAAFRLANHSHSKRNNNQRVKKCVLGKVCAEATSKCRNAVLQFHFSLHEKFNDDFFFSLK